MKRLLNNICVRDIETSKRFYTGLFDFIVNYESDWFVHLVDAKNDSLELGLIEQGHEIVPDILAKDCGGTYLTFVVNDVYDVFQKVKIHNYEIVEEPTEMFYGQNRMLLKDPNGFIIDVSSIVDT